LASEQSAVRIGVEDAGFGHSHGAGDCDGASQLSGVIGDVDGDTGHGHGCCGEGVAPAAAVASAFFSISRVVSAAFAAVVPVPMPIAVKAAAAPDPLMREATSFAGISYEVRIVLLRRPESKKKWNLRNSSSKQLNKQCMDTVFLPNRLDVTESVFELIADVQLQLEARLHVCCVNDLEINFVLPLERRFQSVRQSGPWRPASERRDSP
jgi:hypothetical protein